MSGARAGQAVHVRTVEAGGLPLRRTYPIATADVPSGTLTIQVPGTGAAGAWVRGLRTGDRADMAGPLGRPFEVDPRSRHLLLVADGASIASLRFLIDEAIRDVRSIVLLYGAPSSGEVYPSSLLPDEVEYMVATADGSLGHRGPVVDLVLDYEAWADQAFAAGPVVMLAELARLATGRRARLGVATLGRKRGGGRPVQPGSAEARRKSHLQVRLDQAIGVRGRDVPRMRGARPRRPRAGVPRGSRVRCGRAGLGADVVTARPLRAADPRAGTAS